jgi:hypothetical protein
MLKIWLISSLKKKLTIESNKIKNIDDTNDMKANDWESFLDFTNKIASSNLKVEKIGIIVESDRNIAYSPISEGLNILVIKGVKTKKISWLTNDPEKSENVCLINLFVFKREIYLRKILLTLFTIITVIILIAIIRSVVVASWNFI